MLYTVTTNQKVLKIESLLISKIVPKVLAYDFAKGMLELRDLAKKESAGGEYVGIMLSETFSDDEDVNVLNLDGLRTNKGETDDSSDAFNSIDRQILGDFRYAKENLRYLWKLAPGAVFLRGDADSFEVSFEAVERFVKSEESEIDSIIKALSEA